MGPEAPRVGRRDVLSVVVAAAALGVAGGPVHSSTPGKDAAGKLVSGLVDVESDIRRSRATWDDVLARLSSPPLESKAALKLFNEASKGLPPNILRTYGGDGGTWLGFRNECVDALEALRAELQYLIGNSQADTPVDQIDTVDLFAYAATAVDRAQQYLALFDNTTLNTTVPGGSFCDYSSSEACDDVDPARAGRNTGIRYGK